MDSTPIDLLPEEVQIGLRVCTSNEMNFIDFTRRLSPGSKPILSTASAATIISGGLLCLLAGFTIVQFILNFDQLQSLADEYSIRATQPSAAAAASRREIGTPEKSIMAGAAADPAWLTTVNRYRAMVEIPPVSADARLSDGDALHSHYLAVNYASRLPNLRLGADAHTEDPAKRGFSAEGAEAARASDIDWSWDPQNHPNASWAIDNWMTVPFHRMQIISPYLREVGYGTACQGAICFAALNTGTDIDSPRTLPARWAKPLAFPPDGSVMQMNEFRGEWPDPLTGCPGYASPAGLPVTLEFGHLIVPEVSDYSIRNADDGALIEACTLDANNYVNPEIAAQNAARAVLREFGALIIVPRRPLKQGRYTVTVTAGQKYSWTFSIAPRNYG